MSMYFSHFRLSVTYKFKRRQLRFFLNLSRFNVSRKVDAEVKIRGRCMISYRGAGRQSFWRGGANPKFLPNFLKTHEIKEISDHREHGVRLNFFSLGLALRTFMTFSKAVTQSRSISLETFNFFVSFTNLQLLPATFSLGPSEARVKNINLGNI